MRPVKPAHMIRVLAVAAGLAVSPLAVAAAPSVAAPPTPPSPATAPASATAQPSAALAYYPAAARAAGLEGEAKLHCDRDARLGLRSCQLVSETPAGQGFGAAALALAALSPDNPKVDLPDAASHPPLDVTLRFSLHPPAITPDLTQMGHLVTQPSLLAKPTRAQIEAAYPVRAFSDGVDGAAVIDCLVTAKGALASCRLVDERPTGYGFGAAALDLAADYTLKPRLLDGEAIAGAEVQVPVRFQAQDPSAPLELKTAPATP